MLNLTYCYWGNRTIRCVALGESLVFNVASQKNAISDGFCPFISGIRHVAQLLTVARMLRSVTNMTSGFARRACFLKL